MCQHFLHCLMLTVAYPVSASSDWAPTGPFRQLDAEWDDYIAINQPEYDEERTYSSTEKKASAGTEDTDYDWNLMAPGEVPFVAILYQVTAADFIPTEVRPKKTCGGILVSPNTVVTPCGCIMSFMARAVERTGAPRKKPIGDFFYDMDAVDQTFNFNNLGINRIYVLFSQSEFDASYKDHYLAEDLHGFDASQDCYRKTDPFWTNQGRPKFLDSRTIDATLAIWNMVPAIRYPVPGQFMPWPPVTNRDAAPGRQEKVIISGMGFDVKDKYFTFIDESGNAADFRKRGVNLLLQQCNVISKQCPRDIRRDNTACFCSLHNTYELCNGTIGWPVVNKDNVVVGLTASNRACDQPHGSILVAAFDLTLSNMVAASAGSWAKLQEQNSMRPPLYREDLWLRSISQYDYSDDDHPRDLDLTIDRSTADHALYLKSKMPVYIFTQLMVFLVWQVL